MRKFLLSLMLFIGMGTASAVTYGPNLILNGNLDQYPTVDNKGPDCGSGNGYDPNCTHPLYWRESHQSVTSGWMQYTTANSVCASGKCMYSRVTTLGSGGRLSSYYMNYIGVTAGKTYQWYFTNASNVATRLRLAWFNSSNVPVSTTIAINIPSNNFVRTAYSGTVVVPAGVTKVTYIFDMYAVGVTYTDDAIFRLVTP